jgi:exonuclease III
LQLSNVKTVITNTDIDVWGLAEVSNVSTFNSLVSGLGTYDGIESSFSQTQKTALLWKKSKFNLISSGNVLTAASYSNDFAGRAPLEVVLQTKGSAVIDTIYFYVLHLKANSGSGDQSSYDRRKNAAGHLKGFLDQYRSGKKVVVIGDWNDDVDVSVVYVSGAYLQTPFQNFLDDPSHYFFASQQLSIAGKKSYVYGSQMIDHQMISKALKDSFYIAGSSDVLSQLYNQVVDYGNTTSDHYPIISRYNLKRYPKSPPVGLNEMAADISFNVYPNPANIIINIQSDAEVQKVELINSLGEGVIQTRGPELDIAAVPPGIYFVKLTSEKGSSIRKIAISH